MKPKSKRSKKSLDILYEVLAPGSSVIKTDAYTSLIKESGKREITIRNSDLAKFETKAERQTDLKIYANRRPKIPSGKITEDLINQRAREVRKKLEGNQKMKHKKIADDVSAASSIHSNVTSSLRVRMPVKPKKTLVPAPPQPTTESVTDFAPPMELPLTSIVIAEPPTRPKRKSATNATESFQPTQKRKRFSPSITESDEFLASTQTSPPTTSSSSTPSHQKRRQLIKQTQIQNKSIVSTIQKTAAQNQNVDSHYRVNPCSSVRNNQTQYYISPNYEGQETSMTVGEAERIYESESD